MPRKPADPPEHSPATDPATAAREARDRTRARAMREVLEESDPDTAGHPLAVFSEALAVFDRQAREAFGLAEQRAYARGAGSAIGKPISISSMVYESHATSRSKGWHDEDESPPSAIRIVAWLGLVMSEAAEAIEAVRDGDLGTTWEGDKPTGLPSELADILIRVGDLCGALGIDLEAAVRQKLAYNRTRPSRHGGKRA